MKAVSSTKPVIPTATSIIITLSKVLNFAGIAVVGMLTLMTVADVLGRALFRAPIIGSEEITEYMMACIGFLGLAWCAAAGRHVKVTILTERLGLKVQAILESIMLLVTLVVLIIITWRGVLESLAIQQTGRESMMLHIPEYPFYWVMSVSFVVFCLVVAVQLIQSVSKAAK